MFHLGAWGSLVCLFVCSIGRHDVRCSVNHQQTVSISMRSSGGRGAVRLCCKLSAGRRVEANDIGKDRECLEVVAPTRKNKHQHQANITASWKGCVCNEAGFSGGPSRESNVSFVEDEGSRESSSRLHLHSFNCTFQVRASSLKSEIENELVLSCDDSGDSSATSLICPPTSCVGGGGGPRMAYVTTAG